MLYCKKISHSLKGFTLIESILGVLVIALISGSIMHGITTIEKKLFKIRLKENAFEELRNYTNFLASRILVGDIPGTPEEKGYSVAIYQKEIDNQMKDIHFANINYKEIEKISEPGNNGQVFSLNTYIIWPSEGEIQDTLAFNTFQIQLTN